MNVAVCPGRLDILSLCTGGGGLDLGVELAMPSARTVCMVEREAFAASHLVCAMQQGLLDAAPVWSDVRTFDGRPWRGSVDGLIGGIPCQGHSLAGKKRGRLDPRDLWSPARRIIAQARPWFVLIENVSGILSPGDDDIAGAERLCADLPKLGFVVEAGLFTAAEIGAPHQRARWFCLAVADHGGGRWRAEEFETGRCRSEIAAGGCGGELAHAQCDGRGKGPEDLCAGQSEPAVCGIKLADADRGEPSLDLCLGRNPQQERQAAAGICRPMDDPARLRNRPVSIQQGRQAHAGPDAAGAISGTGLPLFPPGPAARAGWRRVLERAPHLEPALRRMADGMAGGLDAARIERLRLLGNGVVPLQAAYALRTLCARLAGRAPAQLGLFV